MFLSSLVRRSFARVAGILVGAALLLAGLQVALVIIAALQQQSQSFDLLARLAPAFLQRQFGAAFSTFLSFGGLVTFGYFHPVVMLLVALFPAFMATELVADIEGGQVDLLLSRPLARRWLVTRSLVALMLTPVIFVALMMCASWVGLHAFAPEGAPWPSAPVIALMGTHLVAVAWAFGCFALAVAAATRRRMTAMGIAAIAAVSLYLVEILGDAWRPLGVAAVISPFHYYHAPQILAGTATAARDLSVLVMMSVTGAAIAYWRFSTRDV